MPPSSRFPSKSRRGARAPAKHPRLRLAAAALAIIAAAGSFSLPFLSSCMRRQTSLAAESDVAPREPELPAALEAKVRRAHENFIRARTLMREHGLLAREKSWKALTPEDIDALLSTGSLTPSAEQKAAAVVFDEADKLALRAFHTEILAHAAKAAARRPSPRGLSLDAMRLGGPDRITEFCRSVPKGGVLHVHPKGVLGEAQVRARLEAKNVGIDVHRILREADGSHQLFLPAEVAALRKLAAAKPEGDDSKSDSGEAGAPARPPKPLPGKPVAEAPKGPPPPKPRAFAAFSDEEKAFLASLFVVPETWPASFPVADRYKRFDASYSLVGLLGERNGSPLGFPAEAFDAYFASLRESGVSYVEFSKGFPLDRSQAAAVRALIARAEEKHGIVVRVNYAFLRTRPPAQAVGELEGVLKALREADGDGPPVLVGIDASGNETGADALAFAQALYASAQDPRNADIPLRRTFHAGEFGRGSNPRDAMLLGAERLGHAVALRLDTVALEFARRERTPIEINIVSNLRLGALGEKGTAKDHPAIAYQRLGLRPSLSTDNDGIVRTGAVAECEAFVGASDVQYAEYKAMAFQSIDTSFAEAPVREKLRADLVSAFDSFESAWHHVADAR